jgi:hypothetical protein
MSFECKAHLSVQDTDTTTNYLGSIDAVMC